MESACNHGLTCDNLESISTHPVELEFQFKTYSGQNSDNKTEVKGSRRNRIEEWISIGVFSRILRDISRLTNVSQEKTRICNEEPRKLDRSFAEGSHIRKERFDSGEGK